MIGIWLIVILKAVLMIYILVYDELCILLVRGIFYKIWVYMMFMHFEYKYKDFDMTEHANATGKI
jgi:hypothetical protein